MSFMNPTVDDKIRYRHDDEYIVETATRRATVKFHPKVIKQRVIEMQLYDCVQHRPASRLAISAISTSIVRTLS